MKKPGPAERWVDENYSFTPEPNARIRKIMGEDYGTHRVAGVLVDCGRKVLWENRLRGLVIRLVSAYRRGTKAKITG